MWVILCIQFVKYMDIDLSVLCYALYIHNTPGVYQWSSTILFLKKRFYYDIPEAVDGVSIANVETMDMRAACDHNNAKQWLVNIAINNNCFLPI